jgi:FKBP-type peptidyl-prolyl cis-trans isomerase
MSEKKKHMRVSYLSIICLLFFLSCSSPYKKAGNGFEFKIIEAGSGKKLEYGNFVAFHLSQWYHNSKKDSILGDTREYMPRVEAFDSVSMPPVYLSILKGTRKGDSIVIRIPADSAFKPFVNPMPRYFESGGFIYTSIKILDLFESQHEADSANLAEFKGNEARIYGKRLKDFEKMLTKERAQIVSDSKIISSYLEEKKIKYSRGKWGSFIVINKEGTGKPVAVNDVVAVNYCIRILDAERTAGRVKDAAAAHQGSLEVTMSQPGTGIAGLTDALVHLKEGTKATIYIPSSLAYGKKGNSYFQIKPGENVVLDIEVKVVLTEIRAMEIVIENRRNTEAVNDSVKKAIIHKYLFPYQEGTE